MYELSLYAKNPDRKLPRAPKAYITTPAAMVARLSRRPVIFTALSQRTDAIITQSKIACLLMIIRNMT